MNSDIVTTMRIMVSLQIALIWAALAQAQPPAEPAFAGRPLTHWLAVLDSKDALEREEAVEVLGRIGPPAKMALEKLTKMYRADEKMVRDRCALALWRIDQQTEPIFTVLRQALQESERSARLQALERITLIGAAGVALTPELLELWRDSDAVLQARATSIVMQFGAAALPALIGALNHPDKEIQRRALEQFSTNRFRREDVLPALRKKLEEKDPRLRVRIARVIRQLDPLDQTTLPIFVAGTEHKDPAVRYEALQQCLDVFPRPKELADVFRRGMREEHSNLRFRCLFALWQMDRSTAKELIPLLSAIVQAGPGGMEWHQAVSHLGAMGPDAKQVIPVFVQFLEEGKAAGHEHFVMTTLASFGPESADPLVKFMQDARPQYRSAAATALAQLGPIVAERIGPLLKHNDANLRRTAFESVHRIAVGIRPVFAELESGIKDSDPQIRWLAAESLSRFGPEGKAAVPVLIDRLKAANLSVNQRAHIARALGNIGVPAKDALPALHELLKSKDPEISVRAAEAVAQIEGKSDKAVPVLLEVFRRRDTREFVVALGVLARLQADPASIAKVILDEIRVGRFPFTDTMLQVMAEGWPSAKEFTPIYRKMVKARGIIRLQSAMELLAIGEKQAVIDEVKAALSSTDYDTRQFCHTMAIELGAQAKSLAPQLKERWERETVYSLRVRWAEALLRADAEAGKGALTWLRQQLNEPAPMNRQAAAIALARVDPQFQGLLAILLDLMKTMPAASRGPIIDAIGRLGPSGKTAIPALKEQLQVRDGNVHIRAAAALWRVEGKLDDVLPVLLAELPATAKKPAPRRSFIYTTTALEAVAVLAEIGAPAKAAVSALKLAGYAYYPDDDRLKLSAASAIRKIEGK